MKNKLLILLLVASTTMLFTTCKKAAQVDLVGSWKMSSFCNGDDDRATVDLEIFPGSGEDEIIITNVIEYITVYYTYLLPGASSVTDGDYGPFSRDLDATVDKKDISVNFVYTDQNYVTTDPIHTDQGYTISGSGTISDKNERITLDLTITFPNYDPVQTGLTGSPTASPKPLTNSCQLTLVKDRDDD